MKRAGGGQDLEARTSPPNGLRGPAASPPLQTRCDSTAGPGRSHHILINRRGFPLSLSIWDAGRYENEGPSHQRRRLFMPPTSNFHIPDVGLPHPRPLPPCSGSGGGRTLPRRPSRSGDTPSLPAPVLHATLAAVHARPEAPNRSVNHAETSLRISRSVRLAPHGVRRRASPRTGDLPAGGIGPGGRGRLNRRRIENGQRG